MTFILVLLFLILAIMYSINAEKEKIGTLSEAQNQTKDAITFNDRTGVITISQRHSSFKTRFKYEKYVATHYDYTPEKLVFTSATVGGVTTGGVDKVGGHGTRKRHTDRYQIIYEYVLSEGSPKQGHVKEIRLSHELVEKARNSKVKEYLKGNVIMVISPLDASERYSPQFMPSSEYCKADIMNRMEDDEILAHPTLEKCQQIINWISGYD